MTNNDLIVVVIAILGFIVAGFVYLNKNKKKGSSREKPPIDFPPQFKPASKEKLLNMVFGDKQTAERLIQFEKSRMPNASETELIRLAIERLERDRR